MPNTPYLVLDRSTRKVLHQATSLEGARGFSEAIEKPTTLAMIAEHWAATDWNFIFQVVVDETGETIMQSKPMNFDDAADLMYSLKLMLVPACMAKAVTP